MHRSRRRSELLRPALRRWRQAGDRTEPNPEDVEEIASVVKNASRLADLTLVTIHAHEGTTDRLVPAQFLVTFAHAMVDAGADLFAGHGPHVLRGVEMYKGKPILYSLGDFIFQNETLLRLPSDNYEPYDLGPDTHVADFNDRRYDNDKSGFPADRMIWEAIVAVPRFDGRTLAGAGASPNHARLRTGTDRPRAAATGRGGARKKILGDIERLSKPFGTTITTREGVGYLETARESR